MSDFANFRAVYDELTDEVSRSRHQFLPDHLRSWFRHLKETPGVNEIVAHLESGLDFDNWYAEQKTRQTGAGSGTLRYPADRKQQLGMKLLLFRHFAAGKEAAWQFAHAFVYSSSDLNELTHGVIEQIFQPMARELRRHLEAEFARADEVPASDRVVRLDHNSKSYAEAIEAITRLEQAVSAANTFDDPDEKEQREAEVSAAGRLMKAAQVRLEALAAVLKPILVQFATKVKDNVISTAAVTVSGALITLFGIVMKNLLGL